MKDPRRILSRSRGRSTRDELGASMLRAAREDNPSAAARRRAAVALGLAVGTGVAGTTATTAAAAAGSSKILATGGVAVLVKWVFVGVVGAALAVGGARYAAHVNEARSKSTPPDFGPRATTALAGSGRPPRGVAPAIATTTTSSTGVDATDAGGAPPDGTSRQAAPAAGPENELRGAPTQRGQTPPAVPSSLANELVELERVRAQLAAGDTRGALDALDAYGHGSNGGRLAPEAAVLRIEALLQNGDDDAVTSRANEFLRTFPESPQERHVRSILDAVAKKKKR